MFEAVKTVFKRESEMLAGEENRRMKARKVLVKVVNSLTSQSEIGGPMACMYLLNHPDHYISHVFQRFYWRGYVNDVRKFWEPTAQDSEVKPAKTASEKVVIGKSGDQIIAINPTMDYLHRPEKYESVCLYN